MRLNRYLGALVIAGAAMSTGAMAQQTAQTQASASALVKYEIKGDAIPASLTGKPGDVEEGKKIVIGRRLGNCLACHQITALEKEPFHGNTGPSLDGVASRLSEGEMRLRLVDATKINPDTMMPPFYRIDGLNRVPERFKGKPVLDAQQIEDAIAFLKTLK